MINVERLKDARDNFNITQKVMGSMLNITESAYNKFENEADVFPIKKLLEVCDILNISLDYVFNFVDFENYLTAKKFCIKLSAKRLREFRKENKLTQKDLADDFNMDRTTISSYEKEHLIISTQLLFDICKRYKISADYLMGRINEPKYLK